MKPDPVAAPDEPKTYAESSPAVWAGFEAPEGMILGWKVVRPDGRSYGDYQWPLISTDVDAHPGGREFIPGDPCPSFPGDGLCIATSWAGARSGGIAAGTGLALAYRESDRLGSDDTKVRVKGCRVLGVLDLQRLLKEGHGYGADLTRANLSRANLSGADLTGATGYTKEKP